MITSTTAVEQEVKAVAVDKAEASIARFALAVRVSRDACRLLVLEVVPDTRALRKAHDAALQHAHARVRPAPLQELTCAAKAVLAGSTCVPVCRA